MLTNKHNVIGVPRWLNGKESTCKCRIAGDAGLSPGSGRCPGGVLGNPLQYSCWDNPMDRGAWQATWVTKTRTRRRDWACKHAECNQKSPYKWEAGRSKWVGGRHDNKNKKLEMCKVGAMLWKLKRTGNISSEASRRSKALVTPWFSISNLHNCKRMNVYCFKPLSWW